MSEVFSVYDAKALLSKLLDRVEAGEEIVLTRVPGRLRDRGIVIGADFDDLSEQDERDWYGE